ncbi:uncharacterized protein LOC132608235 [Lycium barbarum]|uniref:uncharacterized protein LOC132608235 n=1 Tax=Lycium barbarum TaxID=112863 RepID=UPI00293EB779|nr:uncharacterized protein LOC132608235 [Lycium barbarum]
MVGGDFNVILSEEEKLGGLPGVLSHGRAAEHCIFKRLDRVLANQAFQDLFPQNEVEHLTKSGSDRAPLVLSCGEEVTGYIKPFRFLNFWIQHASFKEVVSQNWKTDFMGSPYLAFKHKLKNLKGALAKWSRETCGNIFEQLIIREEVVKVKEQFFEEQPSIINRIVLQKAQAELKKYLHLEEQYWKQKAGFSWFTEGDKNTNFFHNYVTGQRRKLQLNRIQDGSGNWLETREEILEEAISFLRKHFCSYPTKEEVKKAVSELNGDSSSGPDGFAGVFYQQCWDILGDDVYAIVLAFFDGAVLPKSITHTNLEIVSDIRLRDKPANVILKLEMAKAYDRVSWKYLMHVLRNMGFAEHFITLIWRLVANNWYSILLNGQATEVLSRALNSLFEDRNYIGYGMPKWTNPLNHLAYADDTIIFASADIESLQSIMGVLRMYEQSSGQLVNRAKSFYYMYAKIGNDLVQSVGTITGFPRGQFPFTYLGCPITHSRKKKVFYAELIKKVKSKILLWKGKLLSFGGKATLIKSVLQSIPIHLLSVVVPLKCVIHELHKIFAKYFWSNKEDAKSRHWSAWRNICIPTQEGVLGFKSLFDVSKALFAKLWWRFRTTSTLWYNYMWNKYCKKVIPRLVIWKEGSQVWKKMLEARDAVEHEIWWEIKAGSVNVWHENWTKIEALYHVVLDDFPINEEMEEVAELIEEGRWKDEVLIQNFPLDIVDHIKSEFHIDHLHGYWDKPGWMATTTGKFTVNSA